jgi:hypothetical protein
MCKYVRGRGVWGIIVVVVVAESKISGNQAIKVWSRITRTLRSTDTIKIEFNNR